MDDETILARGGTEHDIEEYAKQNGGDGPIFMVAPHRKISRTVESEDRERVLKTADAMRAWMNSKYTCVGLAHPQIDDNDPLAFFVTLQEPMSIILNPVITNRSDITLQSKEGCMSYDGKDHIFHTRHVAITVRYEVFKGKRMVTKYKVVTGYLALVYQHEIDHLNARYCYDQEK